MVLGGSYPPDIRVRKEANTLIEAGHDLSLLCRGNSTDPPTEIVDGMRVRRLFRRTPPERMTGFTSTLINLGVGVNPRWVHALDQEIRAGADAIHVHDLHFVRTALAATANRDVSVVADLHENYPEAVRQWRRRWDGESTYTRISHQLKRTMMPISRLKWLERSCVARADRVLTVCKEGKTHYVTDCGANPDSVYEISNTVDLNQFDTLLTGGEDEGTRHKSPTPQRDGGAHNNGGERNWDRPSDMPEGVVATYVGRLGVHRGLETVLEALAHRDDTTDTPIQVVIVGPDDNANADALRAHARELGVSDHLFFTGWVDFEDIPKHMVASDVCLVPHASTPHTETTIPHKLFQYMAAARPVLVTDVPPLKRIIEQTNAGIVTPAGDPGAMADALQKLGTDPRYADMLGENGRQAVEEQYRWEHDVETLRGVYRDLA